MKKLIAIILLCSMCINFAGNDDNKKPHKHKHKHRHSHHTKETVTPDCNPAVVPESTQENIPCSLPDDSDSKIKKGPVLESNSYTLTQKIIACCGAAGILYVVYKAYTYYQNHENHGE